MRKWLGRLAFSFVILAAVFAYEGRRAARNGASPTLYYAGAAVIGALGITGLRERHRTRGDDLRDRHLRDPRGRDDG
ncbi:MAG TPA: hypothetical protein VER17_11500 [Tepidisphaeraceae bacterium]|nr:hypothetical protein [Tepidisphaeraceae bacterium]